MSERKKLKTSPRPSESEEASFLPDEIDEAIDTIPDPEDRSQVRQVVTEFGMMMHVSPQAGMMKKITSEHISTYLETQKETMQKSFEDDAGKRKFYLAILIVICIVILLIILLLRDKSPELMEKIITILITSALAGAGGYGFGYKRGKKDE